MYSVGTKYPVERRWVSFPPGVRVGDCPAALPYKRYNTLGTLGRKPASSSGPVCLSRNPAYAGMQIAIVQYSNCTEYYSYDVRSYIYLEQQCSPNRAQSSMYCRVYRRAPLYTGSVPLVPYSESSGFPPDSSNLLCPESQ